MADYKIVVEYRKSPKAARFQNEYEYMSEMMNKVYEIMHGNPQAVVKVWKEWGSDASRKEK